MFKTIITTTPLTSNIADDYYQNIYGSAFNHDVSFLATLRALAAPRMNEDDRIGLRFDMTSHRIAAYGDRTDREIIKHMTEYLSPERGVFSILNINSDPDSNKAYFSMLTNEFTKLHEGYHCLEDMTTFYKKSFDVLCFVNPSTKNVTLFVEKLDMKKLHYLQCSIFAALPWYFDPAVGASDEEMALINSLLETSPDKYLECLQAIADKCDLRTASIKKLLTGFESKFERLECDRVKRSILEKDNSIQRHNQEIGTLISQRNEQCIRLLGLELKVAQTGEDSEIMNYVLCNKKISLRSVAGTDISFVVSDYLAYFDKELIVKILENRRSYVYQDSNRGGEYTKIDPERMVKLLRAVFLDETLRIRFCAAYQLSLNGGVSALDHYDFQNDFNTFMPNPHIDGYRCIGNYSKTINELLANHDYIGAIEQCAASCKSLNWGDSTVMDLFIRSLYGYGTVNSRCIELPDGNIVTPIDAIAWLEKETVSEEAHNEQDD